MDVDPQIGGPWPVSSRAAGARVVDEGRVCRGSGGGRSYLPEQLISPEASHFLLAVSPYRRGASPVHYSGPTRILSLALSGGPEKRDPRYPHDWCSCSSAHSYLVFSQIRVPRGACRSLYPTGRNESITRAARSPSHPLVSPVPAPDALTPLRSTSTPTAVHDEARRRQR